MKYEFDLEKKNKVEELYNYFEERKNNLTKEIKEINRKFSFLQIGLILLNAIIVGILSSQNLSLLQLVGASTILIAIESPVVIIKAIKLEAKKDEKEKEMGEVEEKISDLDNIKSDIRKIEKLKNETLTPEKLHNLYNTYKEVNKSDKNGMTFMDFLGYIYPEDIDEINKSKQDNPIFYSEKPKVKRMQNLF